jgi:hypothetical protein
MNKAGDRAEFFRPFFDCLVPFPGGAREIRRSDEPYPEIVAAVLVVEVVDEGALLAVVEEDPHHAEAAREGGVFLLDNLAPAPSVVSPVFYLIAQLQV